MPKGIKTCPTCGATMGARKLVCDCGYTFVSAKTTHKKKGSTVAPAEAVEASVETTESPEETVEEGEENPEVIPFVDGGPVEGE
jgi:DNA-directed RNA polymerase subunit M/transcription elongation factor TFIIS